MTGEAKDSQAVLGVALGITAGPPEKLRAFLRHGVRFLGRTWRKRVMLAYVREFGPRGHIG